MSSITNVQRMNNQRLKPKVLRVTRTLKRKAEGFCELQMVIEEAKVAINTRDQRISDLEALFGRLLNISAKPERKWRSRRVFHLLDDHLQLAEPFRFPPQGSCDSQDFGFQALIVHPLDIGYGRHLEVDENFCCKKEGCCCDAKTFEELSQEGSDRPSIRI